MRKLRKKSVRVAVITIKASHQSWVWEKDDGKWNANKVQQSLNYIISSRYAFPSAILSRILCCCRPNKQQSNNHKWSFFRSIVSCVCVPVVGCSLARYDSSASNNMQSMATATNFSLSHVIKALMGKSVEDNSFKVFASHVDCPEFLFISLFVCVVCCASNNLCEVLHRCWIHHKTSFFPLSLSHTKFSVVFLLRVS